MKGSIGNYKVDTKPRNKMIIVCLEAGTHRQGVWMSSQAKVKREWTGWRSWHSPDWETVRYHVPGWDRGTMNRAYELPLTQSQYAQALSSFFQNPFKSPYTQVNLFINNKIYFSKSVFSFAITGFLKSKQLSISWNLSHSQESFSLFLNTSAFIVLTPFSKFKRWLCWPSGTFVS